MLWWKRVYGDSALALALFLAGIAIAYFVMFHQMTPDWYRARSTTSSLAFTTSVMVATGHGFVRPAPGTDPPAMTRFLRQEVMTLSPSDLPKELTLTGPADWDTHHRYLLYFVGLVWRITGMSWPVLKWIMVAAFGACAVLLYGILRQGANRFFAVLGTLAFLASSAILEQLPSVRDFLKTPFFFAAWLILAYMIRRKVRLPVYWALAGLLGLICAVGMGFRHDVYICLFASAAILLFVERVPWKRPALERAAALAILLVTFFAASWPVYNAYRASGAPVHDFIMGLSTLCDDELGMSRAAYERVYINHDFVVYAMETDYNRRAMGITDQLGYDDANAERAGLRIVLEFFRLFPADFISRVYASILWTIEGAHSFHWYIQDDRPDYSMRVLAIAWAAAAFALLCTRSPRKAWLAAFLLLFFGAYTSIQFQYRHAFHLAPFGLWIRCFLATQLVAWLWQLHSEGRLRNAWSIARPANVWRNAGVRRGALYLFLAALVFVVPLAAARMYQVRTVNAFLDRYAGAKMDKIEFTPCPLGDWVLFRPQGRMQHRANKLDMLTYESDYVVAEFNRLAPRNVWLVYEDVKAHKNDGSGFSIGLRAPHAEVDPAQTVRLYVPIFEGQEFVTNRIDRLAGIALPKEEAADFRGYYRIVDQQQFKVLPVMWLSSDRRSTPLYQRIGLPGAPINPRMPPFDSWDCPPGNP